MGTIYRTALENPTYETDFYAISKMLESSDSVFPGAGELCIRKEDEKTFVVTSPSGSRQHHLLKEYAIHHLLFHFYKAV